MNELNLLDAVIMKLENLFRGYTLLNKSGELQEVRVFAQYLPMPEGLNFNTRSNTGLKNYNESDMESNFPCIVAKLIECEDREERRIDATLVKMNLLFACYDENKLCQGYRDILNMQERVRDNFLIERVIDNRFRLDMPIKTRLLECETWPVYFGEMDLIFQAGRPVMRKNFVYAMPITA
ncbi:MAG: hypothetical protein IJT21_09340 [Synergistaceae bacterium]|nr:hypothetical protein [Synergistaceae bacterium]